MPTSVLRVKLDGSQARAEGKKTEKGLKSLEKRGNRTSDAFKNMTKIIGILATSMVALDFGKTIIETEKLKAGLVTMTGSMKNSELAFKALNQFAKTTPFTLDQSVNAFVKMKALGLEPTQRALTSFGNTASAMGKDLNQMIGAVADASTMEFERLKEFGIKAKQQSDTVAFTFQGVTTVVKKNSTDITAFLTQIGENNFAGAMDEQMKRLPGLLSNLRDNVQNLWRKIAEKGALKIMEKGVIAVSNVVMFLINDVGRLVTQTKQRMSTFAKPFIAAFGSIKKIWDTVMLSNKNSFISNFAGFLMDEGIPFILNAFALLPKGWQAMVGIMLEAGSAFISSAVIAFKVMSQKVGLVWVTISDAAGTAWDTIKISAGAASDWIILKFSQMVQRIADMVSTLPGFESIAQRASDAAQALRDLATAEESAQLASLARKQHTADQIAAIETEIALLRAKGLQVTATAADNIKSILDQLNAERLKLEATLAQTQATDNETTSTEDLGAALDGLAKSGTTATTSQGALTTTMSTFPAVAAVMENAIKRLDDTFANFWDNIVKNGKISMSSIKDLVLGTIAQLLHAVFTQPIVLRISAAFTGATAASGAAAAVGPGGFIGTGGGFAGSSGLTGLSALFGGTGLGEGLSNLPGIGSLFNGGAGVTNLQFGIAGLIGGILGDKIFGGKGGLGGSLGAMIGTAILPGLGSIIGGLLGGAIGGLFGKKKPEITFAGNNSASDRGDGRFFSSALGGVFTGNTHGGVDQLFPQMAKSITAFDNTLASFLSAGQIQKISDTLKNWSITLKGDALTIENVLKSRFGAILSTFNTDIQQFVSGVSTLQEQTQRLALAVQVQSLIDNSGGAFGTRGFSEFVAVAQAMQTGTETLTAAFQRLVKELASTVIAGGLLTNYMGTDLQTAYQDLITKANIPLSQAFSQAGADISKLIGEFDGTSTSLINIAGKVASRYALELKMLAQVDSVIASVTSNISGLRTTIETAMRTPEQNIQFLHNQAAQIAATLPTLTDASAIDAAVKQIEALKRQEFNLLDPTAQLAQGSNFLAFLNQVESDALAALNNIRGGVVASSDVLRNEVMVLMSTISDPLLLVANAHQGAADALLAAGNLLIGAGTGFGPVGDPPGGGFGIGPFFPSTGNSATPGPDLTSAVTAGIQAGTAALVTVASDLAVATADSGRSDQAVAAQIAAAISSIPGRINIIIQPSAFSG